MYARTTIAQFYPGATEEALHIVSDIMLPRAREQPGFQGALILRHPDKDQGIIITFWETEDDLLASEAPEDIQADIERLGELITEECPHLQPVAGSEGTHIGKDALPLISD
jgi:heme-degrading monooxygenase HmoA